MVGRLVEQQHVGALQQQLGKLDAHAPAAGKLGRGPLEVRAHEAEAYERLFHLGFAVVAAAHAYLLGQRRHAVYEVVVGVALVVGALGQFGAHGVELCLHAVDVGECLAHLFLHGERVLEHHLLRQIAHGDVLRHGHSARRGLLQAGYYLEHGAFARAVLAHEGDFVARVYHIAYIVEKRFGGKFHRQVVNRNHAAKLRNKSVASIPPAWNTARL